MSNIYLFLILQLRYRALLRKILGNKLYNGIIGAGDYIVNKPNPILQIFYLFLVIGGTSLFMLTGFAYIPGLYISSFHLFGLPTMMCLTLLSFYIASNSNPGTVTSSELTKYVNTFEYDDILYAPKECTTCNIQKPARSKHCSICGRCVARYDHHCAWVNNDIGHLNLRYFLLFLLMTAIQISYVFVLAVYVLKGEADARNVWYYRTQNGTKMETPYSYIVEYFILYYTGVSCLALFTLPVGLMLYGFLAYHLWLIYRNTTTNETIKWGSIYDQIKMIQKNKQSKSQGIALKNICNIYNKGLIVNFTEVLFPMAKKLKKAKN